MIHCMIHDAAQQPCGSGCRDGGICATNRRPDCSDCRRAEPAPECEVEGGCAPAHGGDANAERYRR